MVDSGGFAPQRSPASSGTWKTDKVTHILTVCSEAGNREQPVTFPFGHHKFINMNTWVKISPACCVAPTHLLCRWSLPTEGNGVGESDFQFQGNVLKALDADN